MRESAQENFLDTKIMLAANQMIFVYLKPVSTRRYHWLFTCIWTGGGWERWADWGH